MSSDQSNLLLRWRSAREQLDDAIQSYLQHATDIAIAASDPTRGLGDSTSLHVAIAEAQLDSSLSPARAQRLTNAQAILSRIRIGSTTPSPINRLPSEILLRVFQLVVWQRPCALSKDCLVNPHLSKCNCATPTLVLSFVCNYWRFLMFRTPSFWSHIVLTLGAMDGMVKLRDRSELFLRRTYGHPLCVWIDGERNTTDHGMQMLGDCLRSYYGNIESLAFINNNNRARINTIISLWLTHGRAGSVRALTIWLDNIPRHWVLQLPAPDELNEEDLASFLEPVHTVRFNGAFFWWDNPVYHNLRVLQLGNITRLGLHHLTGILAACPQLHTFQLLDMHLKSFQGEPVNAIMMNQLRTLEIRNMYPGGLGLLLPKMLPNSQGLAITIDLSGDDSDVSAVRIFLARCSVRVLRVTHITSIDRLALYLSAVSEGYLDTLILCCEKKSRAEYNRYELREDSSWSTIECSRGHELHITNGSPRGKSARDIVVEHLLDKKTELQFVCLRLVQCCCNGSTRAIHGKRVEQMIGRSWARQEPAHRYLSSFVSPLPSYFFDGISETSHVEKFSEYESGCLVH